MNRYHIKATFTVEVPDHVGGAGRIANLVEAVGT